MKSSLGAVVLAATLAASNMAHARDMPTPSEAAVVQAQGRFAAAQLQSLAMIFGHAPASVAREAFASGNAAIAWRHYSPALRGVSRGPTLSESIAPLLANVRAARDECPSVEGPCQDRAWTWAKERAEQIRRSVHPGKALASTLDEA